MIRSILGIDPGLDAFACIYRPDRSVASGIRWTFFDIPTSGEAGQRRIDAVRLRDWITLHNPDIAYIEVVGTFLGEGSVTRFIRAVGAIEATVQCCSVPIVYVVPQRWKAFYDVPKYAKQNAAKEHSRILAQQLWPELKDILTRKMDHGRAEAALLAGYGAYQQQPIKAGDEPYETLVLAAIGQ